MQQVNISAVAKALTSQERLFVSLADGIGSSMLQLALLSEQAVTDLPRLPEESWKAVSDISRSSMQLLEAYSLTMRLQGGTAEPELEPVALGSLLHETKRMLEPYAAQQSMRLEVDLPHRLEPVVSDPMILRSALVSLGQVFVTAGSQTGAEQGIVRLRAYRTRYGIVAGWYSQGIHLTASAFSRAKRLGGWAQQPYSELVSGPATGVFLADSLLGAVSSRLHVAKYHNSSGLAATLPVCNQLRLV